MGIRCFNPTKDNPWIICNLASLEEAMEAKRQGADAIEFRCDLALESGKNPVETLERIRKAVPLPILGTIRRAGDGGSWFYAYQGDEAARMRLFKEIIPFVDAVDVEIDSEIKEALIPMARASGMTIIVSYHNCLSTEKEEKILERIEQAKATGGDIIKLAYLSRDEDDVLRLFRILKKYTHDVPLAIIGMGEAGTVTRLVFPCFGSCLTYGYLEGAQPGAPGQISIDRIRSLLDGMNHRFSRFVLKFILSILSYLFHRRASKNQNYVGRGLGFF